MLKKNTPTNWLEYFSGWQKTQFFASLSNILSRTGKEYWQLTLQFIERKGGKPPFPSPHGKWSFGFFDSMKNTPTNWLEYFYQGG